MEQVDVEELRIARIRSGLSVKDLAHKARDMGYTTNQAFYDAEAGRRPASKRLVDVYRTFCGYQAGKIEPPDAPPVPFTEVSAHETIADLFRPVPSIQLGTRKEMAAIAKQFSHDHDLHKPIPLESAEEVTRAALHLILHGPPDGYPDEIQIVQRAAISAWSSLTGSVSRQLVPLAIRSVVERKCHVLQTLGSSTLEQNRAPRLMFRRYAELQRLPGDYEYTRDDTSPRSGATDTIVRPGVGVLHAVVEDATGLSVTGGDCFMHACAPEYVARRSDQARQLVRGRSSPFVVHDPSGSYASDARRIRVERAIVQLESIRGPRVVVGDGLSDLLAPQEVYEEFTSRAFDDQSPKAASDTAWLGELAQCHEQRLGQFRNQVVRFPFSDFTPIATVRKMVEQTPQPQLVHRHLTSVAEYLETFVNYRLFLLEDALADAITGSGIGVIVKQGVAGGSENWQMFFESNSYDPYETKRSLDTTNKGAQNISVCFQTGAERYRSAYESAFEKVVEQHIAGYDRQRTIDRVRKFASRAAERARGQEKSGR